jgi:hypothetical protein
MSWEPHQDPLDFGGVRIARDRDVEIGRLSPNALIYQTPAGAQIGQSYDAISVRSQFAF